MGYTGWVGGVITALPVPPSEAPTEQGPLIPAAALPPTCLPRRRCILRRRTCRGWSLQKEPGQPGVPTPKGSLSRQSVQVRSCPRSPSLRRPGHPRGAGPGRDSPARALLPAVTMVAAPSHILDRRGQRPHTREVLAALRPVTSRDHPVTSRVLFQGHAGNVAPEGSLQTSGPISPSSRDRRARRSSEDSPQGTGWSA